LYASGQWGHGASKLALLPALDRRDLAADNVIRVGALDYAVSDEVAALIPAAWRNESEQGHCLPLASPRLPIALAAR
jgi:hypothetical protein